LDVLGVCVVGDETSTGVCIFYVWYLVEYWVGVVVDILVGRGVCTPTYIGKFVGVYISEFWRFAYIARLLRVLMLCIGC
jgi:hypothetical protein